VRSPIERPGPVAFIGLGSIGGPMAACLARAGWKVRAFDADPRALSAFVAEHAGAVACTSAADAARGAPAVITMLPDGRVVRQAVLGPDGAAAALRPGDLVIDMTSSSPDHSRSLGADLAVRGIGFIDAPVSGGVRSARTGRLAVMAGGDPAELERARDLLGAIGTHVFHLGPLGSGHAMKALNNYVSAAALLSTCEALVIGREMGLDPGTMVDVMNAGTGRNSATVDKARQYILSGTFASGGALSMLAKDVRFARALGDDAGVQAALLARMTTLLDDAEASLGGTADHTELFRYAGPSRAPR